MNRYAGIVHRSQDQHLLHLPLQEVDVRVWMVDVSARVVLSQVFENVSENPTSRAKYVFPLPASAAVCAFELEHADGRVVGEVKEKSDAAQTFQSALDAGKIAGLVELVTDDIFTISIGSIPALYRSFQASTPLVRLGLRTVQLPNVAALEDPCLPSDQARGGISVFNICRSAAGGHP